MIPVGFRHLAHGYATTSHAAQGQSVDKGILVMADDGLWAGNLRQAYVSHSRFEKDHVTYTTDKNAAADVMATPADRQLAVAVADFLRVSLKTVFNLRKKGLPYVQLGGAVRFIPQEIKDYLVTHRGLSSHRLRQIVRKGGAK